MDTTWGTDNDLGTILESLHVITNASTTNACVAFNVHEVTDGNNDLLDLLSQLTGWGKDQSLALLNVGVKLLEDRDGESGGFSGTRLSLGNNIMALDDMLETLVETADFVYSPLMTGIIARCWIAEGRSKP